MSEYEIHLTVRRQHGSDRLTGICEKLGVKLLHLENYVVGRGWTPELVTSFVCRRLAPMQELRHQTDAIRRGGFSVPRAKIETAPTHPACPQERTDGWRAPWQYIECHVRIERDDLDAEVVMDLAQELAQEGVLISRRADKSRIYATLRRKSCHQEFISSMVVFLSLLRHRGWATSPGHVEFAIYDPDGEKYDREWVCAAMTGG